MPFSIVPKTALGSAGISDFSEGHAAAVILVVLGETVTVAVSELVVAGAAGATGLAGGFAGLGFLRERKTARPVMKMTRIRGVGLRMD